MPGLTRRARRNGVLTGLVRRLNGYPTYAFGYGNMFVIAIDSNIATDPIQLSWVANQLERLDRERFPHVAVFFHHPPFSSGPHSGAKLSLDVIGTGPTPYTPYPGGASKLVLSDVRRSS